MFKNRLATLLTLLLAVALLFGVSVFAVAADESSDAESVAEATSEESASEAASEAESADASSATSSATSSAAESATASTASSATESTTSDDGHNHSTGSSIPWKLIITLAVIVVIAAVLFILAKTNSKLGQKIAKFFKDYKSELKKISWMPRNDLIRSTLVVLVVLLVSGVAIGLLDFVFSSLVKLLSSI